ncbi:MAG TPA: ABC transporter substrate-binding protein, partial [Bacilli bacterium]|nr:ABC transporter substrate-binding protein [Bacilli bacterium]
MKKLFIPILIVLLICLLPLTMWPKKKDNKLKEIKVAEVAHSIFYAPMYASKNLGYFEDEGLDVEIILTSGADKVTAAVLSNDVQIGFCGSKSTIYVYNEGEKDYLVNFAGLTKKDGSFIVSRNKTKKDFKIADFKNSYIIAGREGGMPAMTFEWILNQNKITKNDLTFDTSIAFAAMSGAFIGGTGDYVALFEPTASALEKEGYGNIVASLGELGGVVPYTTFNARKSYIEKNEKDIKKFNNAINKGLEYVHSHSAKEVAEVIIKDFPDVSINDLTNIVQNYMDIDSWFENTNISEENFNH